MGSLCDEAPIDDEFDPGNETGLVTCEVNSTVRDIVRCADRAERAEARHGGYSVAIGQKPPRMPFVACFAQHLRVDAAGMD